MPDEEPRYIGLTTRTVAFVVDWAIIDLVAILTGAAVALVVTPLHVSSHVETVLCVVGAACYALFSAAYFIGFWSATGQTPGGRIMHFRVVLTRGEG
jgi:uncharacterized RDD family membrane protein YckC